MNRRKALQQLGTLALLASPVGIALGYGHGHGREHGYGQGTTKEGDFEALRTAVPSNVSGKIEVLEFFHYSCSHCMEFEPLIGQWAKRLPDDVAFARVPVIWGGPLEGFARLHYALLATKRIDLHEKVFADIQVKKLPLDREKGVRTWAEANKLNVSAFMKAYASSIWVDTQVKPARKLIDDYKIQSVPTMAVGGRFLTSATLAGSHEGALKVVDRLIERARRKG